MAKKQIYKTELARALEDAGISGRVIKRGDIWTIADDLITFPEARLPKGKRKKHDERPVLILSSDEDLNNIRPLTALISPLSTVMQKAVTDFIIRAGTGGLSQDSVVRLGLIQPILKVDLKLRIGNIGPDTLDQVTTVLLSNLGVVSRGNS